MRKTLSAVAVVIAAVFLLAPTAGAQDADDCDIYVTPVISADGSVTQGEALSVSGSGFAAGADVTISINGVVVGSVVADASGSFTTTVTVPADAPVGVATVTATSPSCDHSASTGTEVLSAGGSTTPTTPSNVQNTGATAKPTSVAAATQTPASATLPRTGSNTGPLVALAVGLTGLGAVALLAARRRTSDIT